MFQPHSPPFTTDLLQDAIVLLQWLLANPGRSLKICENTITWHLFEAGILTKEGVFDPTLHGLLPLLEKPHLGHLIPASAGGQTLKWLQDVGDSEEGQTIKSLLRSAGEQHHCKNNFRQLARVDKSEISREPYAIALSTYLRSHSLDTVFLSNRFNHSSSNPERITCKIQGDLANQAIINSLSLEEPCVARWQLYDSMRGNENYKPDPKIMEKAGILEDSLPALRAHAKRGGLHLVPGHLILHVGKKVLRVAVFCTENSENSPAFRAIKSRLQEKTYTDGITLGKGKAIQLDASILNPAEIETAQLFNEVKKIWVMLRDHLCIIPKKPQRPSWLPKQTEGTKPKILTLNSSLPL